MTSARPPTGPELIDRFWEWYDRHYRMHLLLAAGLFMLQLVHLYWLSAHVVSLRMTGVSYFTPNPFWQSLLILVDYTEIPALITTSLLYLRENRRKFQFRNLLFLVFLNSQWLHLFWITDEFVLDMFAGNTHGTTVLPLWLAWVAILIDYLELPVIVDTLKKSVNHLRKGEDVLEVFKEE